MLASLFVESTLQFDLSHEDGQWYRKRMKNPRQNDDKDSIFQVRAIEEDFVFNERVAQVFDDMLDRSVPF